MRESFFEKVTLRYDHIPHLHGAYTRSVTVPKCSGDGSGDVDGGCASCHYYAGHMAKYTGTPRDQIHVVPLGLNREGHGEVKRELDSEPFIIGYLARIWLVKGLHC